MIPTSALCSVRRQHEVGSEGYVHAALRWVIEECDSLTRPLAIRFATMATISHKTTLSDICPGNRAGVWGRVVDSGQVHLTPGWSESQNMCCVHNMLVVGMPKELRKWSLRRSRAVQHTYVMH